MCIFFTSQSEPLECLCPGCRMKVIASFGCGYRKPQRLVGWIILKPFSLSCVVLYHKHKDYSRDTCRQTDAHTWPTKLSLPQLIVSPGSLESPK